MADPKPKSKPVSKSAADAAAAAQEAASHGKRIGALEDRLAKLEAVLKSALNVSFD